MHTFNPSHSPEITIYFSWIPGQRRTFADPGFEPEIEINEMHINGLPVSMDIESVLIDRFGRLWELEIIKQREAA